MSRATSRTVDAVRLEVIRNALVSAAEEMSVTIWRTSRSPVVRDILDYSCAVFDADGHSTAQAARQPVHLNSMASCLTGILAGPFPLEQWDEGDLIVTNDPYSGGQHLPDILTFKPVFMDGRRIAIVGVLVHHLDVGGGAPGSYHAGATEVFQEGFRIPPLKLDKRGVRNHEIIQLFMSNTREPALVGGDFASQLAALDIGVANLQRIGRRYGADDLAEACRAIQAQSEGAMRAIIRAIPDGTYSFEDFVDDDGIERGRPIRVHVDLTVSGDTLAFDFSGSSPQAKGPVNCTFNMTDSAVVCGTLMSVGSGVPANAGCYRPITITAPEGLCVNARSPAPVANRMAVGHRVVNAVMGAFAQALPDRIPAAYYGVSYVYAFNAIHAGGRRQVYFDLECGGWGGHPEEDGGNAFCCGFHNNSNAPIEMIENGYPVTFQQYRLIPDSGGVGKRRGGLGLIRSFRVDSPEGTFSANLDRFTVPPYGLQGGGRGRGGRLWVRRSGDEVETELPSKISGLEVSAGDVLALETSGGGGWGDPAERESAWIDRDVENGYVTSAEAARGRG
jgi:N-methylhydantoinase B